PRSLVAEHWSSPMTEPETAPELTPGTSAEAQTQKSSAALVVVKTKRLGPPSRNGLPKLGGRRKGTKNKIRVEGPEMAQKLVEDPIYLRRLKADIRKRKVHPQMEVVLWAYAFGRPVARVELGRVGDFSKLSDAELRVELEKVLLFFPSTPTTV